MVSTGRVLTPPELAQIKAIVDETARQAMAAGRMTIKAQNDHPMALRLVMLRSLLITAMERWEMWAMQTGLAQAWNEFKAQHKKLEGPEFEKLEQLLRTPEVMLAEGRAEVAADEGQADPDEQRPAVHLAEP